MRPIMKLETPCDGCTNISGQFFRPWRNHLAKILWAMLLYELSPRHINPFQWSGKLPTSIYYHIRQVIFFNQPVDNMLLLRYSQIYTSLVRKSGEPSNITWKADCVPVIAKKKYTYIEKASLPETKASEVRRITFSRQLPVILNLSLDRWMFIFHLHDFWDKWHNRECMILDFAYLILSS